MKTKTIVIRGCIMKVSVKRAKELEELERKAMKKDWENNRVD